MTETSCSTTNSSSTTEPVWSAQSDDPASAVFSLKIAPLLLCLTVIALLCVGMAMIHSATIATKGDYFFTHQLMWIGIGLFIFLFAAFAPLRFFYRYSHWGVLLIILPLAYLAAQSVVLDGFIRCVPGRFSPIHVGKGQIEPFGGGGF